MVALTYGIIAGKAVAGAVTKRQGWFQRLLKAMMESREEQARREIRMYTRMSAPRSSDLPLGG